MRWSVRNDFWALHGMMHGQSCFLTSPSEEILYQIGGPYRHWHTSCISFQGTRDRSPATEVSPGNGSLS
jgi:hypothetical protein